MLDSEWQYACAFRDIVPSFLLIIQTGLRSEVLCRGAALHSLFLNGYAWASGSSQVPMNKRPAAVSPRGEWGMRYGLLALLWALLVWPLAGSADSPGGEAASAAPDVRRPN